LEWSEGVAQVLPGGIHALKKFVRFENPAAFAANREGINFPEIARKKSAARRHVMSAQGL